MDRAEQHLATTLTFTFSSDGVATDPAPASATVTVSRADGTVLHTDAATTHAGTGKFSYKLVPADTALLDTLDLAWTATLDGVAQTFHTQVEIVGGFYFSVAEALALPELAGKSAAEIAEARTLAEQAFEDACGVAFVPRYQRVTLSARHGFDLSLPKYPVRAVRDVTETTALGGTPTTVPLSGLAAVTTGIYRQAGWTAGPGNVIVGYEYGRDRPPQRVSRAVLLLAKNWLTEGPIDARATSAAVEGGTITLLTPGVRGSVFGIPEVDATVAQYGIKQHMGSIPISAASNDYFRPAPYGWGTW